MKVTIIGAAESGIGAALLAKKNKYEVFVSDFGEIPDKYKDELIKNNSIKVKVLSSVASWFGVTYKNDKPIVIDKLNRLIEEGAYPKKLW